MKLSKKDQEFLTAHLKQKKNVRVFSEVTLSESLHNKSILDARREAREFLKQDSLQKRLKR